MENRAKLRFPRTLLSPFASCKAHKLISDVILHSHLGRRRQQPEQLIPFSSTSIEPLLPTSSSQKPATPYPSMCKPRCPETFNGMVRETCILSLDRHKIHPSNDAVRGGGWMRCPPVSPVSKQGKQQKQRQKEKEKSKKKKKKKRLPEPRRKDWNYRFSSSYEDWFSSDDEREEDDDNDDETQSGTDSDTMFSSSRSFISLSSSKSDPDSFGSTRTRKPPSARRREARRNNNNNNNKKKKKKKKGKADLEEKVKGSFAVVKTSRDPYNDFRASMVEMITEKKIYGARELEQLLQCFLSLNSPHHHGAIVEVFAEICDALFFNQLGL